MKNLLFQLLGSAPAPLIHFALGADCLLPYYHMVSDEYVPHVAPLYAYRNLARFKADLDLLARGRKALTLEEFLTVTRDGNPPPKNSLLLTFDDGFREMHDLAAPILTAKGIPATFFVISETLDNQALCFQQKIALLIQRTQTIATPAQCTATQAKLSQAGIKSDNIGAALKSVPWAKRAILDELAPLFELNFSSYARQHQPYLSSTQISTLLNRGFSIGAHSISHPRYADLTHEEQRGQTRESMEALATRFSLKHRAFAFPHTDHGVGRAFFDTVRREAIVEATFGTSGPALDCVANSFQRFSMEKPDLPGKPLLARHAIRGLRSKRVNRS